MLSHEEFMEEIKEKSHFTNEIKKDLSPESKEDRDAILGVNE